MKLKVTVEKRLRLVSLSKRILDPQHSNFIFLSCFMQVSDLLNSRESTYKVTKIFVYNVNSVHFLLKSRTAVSKFSEMASSSSKTSRIASKLSPTVNYEQIIRTIRHIVFDCAQSRDVVVGFHPVSLY